MRGVLQPKNSTNAGVVYEAELFSACSKLLQVACAWRNDKRPFKILDNWLAFSINKISSSRDPARYVRYVLFSWNATVKLQENSAVYLSVSELIIFM